MTRVTLRGLLGRKLRTVLTALAIVLGVAMVSGSFVLTDTISKAFDTIFASSYEETDAVVSGRSTTDWSQSGKALVPESALDRIRAVPQVDAAAGEIFDLNSNANQAKLIDHDGKVVTGGGNPTFGLGVDPSPQYERFNPLKLTSGRWAESPGEVVLDANAASKYDFGVGDPVEIEIGGPIRSFHVVGVAKFGDVATIGGATFAVFDVRTAQKLLDKDGYDAISIAAKPGVSDAELVSALRKVVPATTMEVRTGAEQAKEDEKGVAEFIDIIRWVLLGFGGVALFVGAFVIFNTLSITIAQRTREFATLRTLGASRRQLLRSVILESFVTGLLASLIGLAAGLGIAALLTWIFTKAGIDLPRTETVFALRTVIVSLGMGTLVTLLAGVMPAIRATRIAPILAVREGAVVAGKRRSPVWGIGTIAAAVAALGAGLYVGGIDTFPRIALLVGGALVLFVGVAMVAGRLVRPLASVVSIPASRIGGPAGRLARENALRNPGRTAMTAAALMIGLALVTFVSVFGTGLRASDRNAITKQIDTDYAVLSQNTWTGLPPVVGQAVAQLPRVDVASSVRYDRARVGSSNIDVSGVDPATITQVYRFDWKDGSDATLESLGMNGAIVRSSFAKGHDLSVGSPFILRTPGAKPVHLVVRGTYSASRFDPLLGHVVVSQRAFDASFQTPSDMATFVKSSEPKTHLKRALARYADARVLTENEFVDDRSSDLTDVLNLLYVLLALSVVVSLFGMVNTLALAVFERTREIGMLRAIGFTRRQTRRMVRHESVITALIGAGLGLPLGIGLAAAVTHALSKYGVGLSIPVGSLVAFTVVAVIAGTLAAILPARRAARLNVLAALQYE
jgi:putative ABC transport system permease protein